MSAFALRIPMLITSDIAAAPRAAADWSDRPNGWAFAPACQGYRVAFSSAMRSVARTRLKSE
jgi:hypothetical protein